MTKKIHTKRALLMSALALLLCMSMLIGSTFAWFTDTVTSGSNKIQAGTLKIDLEMLDTQGNWVSIKDNQDPIFNYEKWEPGYTDVKVLRVVNEGTLALKWYAKFVSQNELSELAKVIDVYVNTNATKMPVDRSLAGYTRVGTVAEFVNTIETTTTGELLAGEEGIAYLGIALKMQEEAGNDYQGLDLGGYFDIQIQATQLTYEEDSFDKTYDEDAKFFGQVGTASELAAALANNQSVKLLNDIDLSEGWTPIGNKDEGNYYTGTLDGNGHKITGLTVASGDYVALISAAKDATIKNLTVEGAVSGDNAAGVVARVEGETVIENVTSNVTVNGNTKAGGIACNVTNSTKTVFINCVNNGDVSGGNSGIGGIVGYANNDAYVEILSCKNYGDITSTSNKYAGAAVGYAAGTSKGIVADMVNEGTITGTLLSDGRYLKYNDVVLCGYVGTIGNWAAALAATPDNVNDVITNVQEGGAVLLSAGDYGTIVVKSNITVLGTPDAVVDCVDLNGAENVTLKNIVFDAAGAQVAYDGKGNGKQYANIHVGTKNKGALNIVIDGCTFTGAFANGGTAIAFTDQGRGSGQSGNITVKNCTFDTTGSYYDIYFYYSGKEALVIENNTFASTRAQGIPVYLGRYQSNTPVVVKGNTFETTDTLENSVYLQAHSSAYTVSLDAANNTFNG